ncbi:MAG: metal ABC transporter permease [Steroidobacteraceae bacterium]|jgi:zinc/manganese transport system permease protein|nr:metal ABC transporter permease [Steroidobacteraceae bacterium]
MSGAWTPFLEFLFLRRALVGSAILATSMAPLGTLLILRRMSLVGDAMAHAVLPGAVAGFLLAGLSVWAMALGGFVAAIVVALLAALISRRTREYEESSFAALYLIALATGVAGVAATGGRVDLTHLLFGSVLAVDADGLVLAAVVATCTWCGLALLYRPLVLATLQESFFDGTHVAMLVQVAFTTLVVMNLVAGFQVLGTLMAVGLLILPAAAARHWATRLEALLGLSATIGLAAAVAGLMLSFQADLPSGPSIVLCAGLAYLLSVIASALRAHARRLDG